MTMQNVKPIGNGYLEATCKDCAAIFLIELKQGEDTFLEIDDNRDTWPLCSKCYKGPRGDPSKHPGHD